MTVLWGDTGKVSLGTLKKFDITLATPRETLLGTPVALPTTQPGTPQISLTVGGSDLPTISPSPISTSYTAMVYTGGRNTDAASQTVNYQIYKNGSSVATGSQTGLVSNNYWTHNYPSFFGIVDGDVITVSLWATSVNVNYDYYAIIIMPTRIQLAPPNVILKDLYYGGFSIPTLTMGTPSTYTTGSWKITPSSIGTMFDLSIATTFPAYISHATYGLGRTDQGDATTSVGIQTNTTNRPRYATNRVANSITFREVLR